jgi:hypothetical protein
LITGASDDDPSGIATYSQTGAQFGYAMCWVMLFCFPLMAAVDLHSLLGPPGRDILMGCVRLAFLHGTQIGTGDGVVELTGVAAAC